VPPTAVVAEARKRARAAIRRTLGPRLPPYATAAPGTCRPLRWTRVTEGREGREGSEGMQRTGASPTDWRGRPLDGYLATFMTLPPGSRWEAKEGCRAILWITPARVPPLRPPLAKAPLAKGAAGAHRLPWVLHRQRRAQYEGGPCRLDLAVLEAPPAETLGEGATVVLPRWHVFGLGHVATSARGLAHDGGELGLGRVVQRDKVPRALHELVWRALLARIARSIEASTPPLARICYDFSEASCSPGFAGCR
jgi:hypothetical protein